MTTNVHISLPHASADKRVRVRAVAIDADNKLRAVTATHFVEKDADSLSLHIYPGNVLLIEEVDADEAQA